MAQGGETGPRGELSFRTGDRRAGPAVSVIQGAPDVPKSLKIVAAVVVVCASAAIGWFGVKWWQSSQQTPGAAVPSSSPTPTTTPIALVRLTFDRDDVTAQATPLLVNPICGEPWDASPTAANGVQVSADASLDNADGIDEITLTASFATDGEPLAFLSSEGDYVVTRDGIVVSPDWGAEFVPTYYVADATGTSSGAQVTLAGATLCDVSDELAAIWADVDFSTATEAEIQAAQDKADAFNAEHAALPPGEYKIYATAPVLVGEEAAIARALSEEGVDSVGTLAYSIGDTPLATDERLQPYCDDITDASGELIGRDCNVPSDVLLEILTRDVPQAYVVEGQPALAVSEPVVIVVE